MGRLTVLAGFFLLLWGALAAVTIVLVSRARDGSVSWALVIAAGVGAAACLFVAMLLWARRSAVRRGEIAPRRTPTHRG
ncbi:MAG: hypothetical protein JOZ82_08645 [Marmoricola sp.]|nr:hypothetical protein [Marmoricola sp.]